MRQIVEEGAQEVVDALQEFDDINMKFAEPMSDDEMNALIEKQGKLQDKLDHMDAWNLDSRLDLAMDALRCPPGDTAVSILSGGERRRVALVRLLLQAARHPAARRTHQPPRCRIGRLAGTPSARISRHGHRRHP